MKTLFVLASAVVVLFLTDPNKIEAQKPKTAKIIEGTISDYECGDNCYLTITDKTGKQHIGLCTAHPLCTQWNRDVTMPASYKGKSVRVTVGKGTLLTGSGGVVGTMDAFTRIQLLTAPTNIPRNSPEPKPVDVIGYSFEQYAVPLYRGSSAKPNFQSKPGSVRFKTRILDGIREGVNFAGHYAIIAFGCGTSCSFGFLVDVKSGRIFDLPLGGEENYGLSLAYRPNSRLMRARWIDALGDIDRGDDNWSDHPMCVRQEFVLNGNAFKLLNQTKHRTKTINACLS